MGRHLALFCLLSSPAWADCTSEHYGDVSALHLIEASDQFFDICYDARYGADVELARPWLRKALTLGLDKYGVAEPWRATVFLVPQATSSTGPGYVVNRCDTSAQTCEIHYLTPSAWPDWTRYGVCWPNMQEYHAHYIVHEMMHTVQFSLESDSERWIWEALAEYDAYQHSSTWNRTGGINNLLELAHYSHQDDILYALALDGQEYLLTRDDAYVGGAVIMLFLADTYGEEMHLALLQKPMNEVLEGRGASVAAAYAELVEWFEARPEHETYERCRRM